MKKNIVIFLAGLCLAQAVIAQSAVSTIPSEVRTDAASIAAELVTFCPLAPPSDAEALSQCSTRISANTITRETLPNFVLWGRQKNANLSIKESHLTQFGKDAFTQMYLSLFMFNGKHQIVRSKKNGELYELRFETAFRNRLPPGHFPYPFWHSTEKWDMYEKATELVFYWDASIRRTRAIQFTSLGGLPKIQESSSVKHPTHDGKWMWTDEAGQVQPVVTLFSGHLRRGNPFARDLETSYKTMALQMREGNCLGCHEPSNPDGSKKLVLLQTPMHAASEIDRLISSVHKDRMPMDEYGVERPMQEKPKQALLKAAQNFRDLYRSAQKWDNENQQVPK
jgi:hypothetical protein